ncbi:MAG: efflux RND transporter periplasmic adaptor subunit [Deltaproteobacteria bacterium]|nr:efflux RND transporter periplasmic adaptor subunit [Deltaproteobacteria bacterium]
MSDELSSDLASLRIDRDTVGRSGRGKRWLLLLIAVGATVAVLYAVALPYLKAKLFKTEVAITEILRVSPAQASVELSATGYVVPQRVSRVGAKIPGRIATLAVKEGDSVKRGQLLVKLEDADKRSAIAEANARVAAAQAKRLTAEANLLEARQKAARQVKLRERGVAAVATVEDLQAHVQALVALVKAAKAEVAAARAQLTRFQVDLGYTEILAPINGTVLGKPRQLGETVGPETMILELADFSSILIEVDVPEARLARVRPSAPCEVILDAFAGKRFRCEVVRISPKVDRAKATAVVKARFVDEPQGVLPNMAARVSFLSRALDAQAVKAPPKTIVPTSAVVTRNGMTVVFVDDDGRARMRSIRVGGPFMGGLELLEGPPVGTRLVKQPPEALKDGQKIKERESGR